MKRTIAFSLIIISLLCIQVTAQEVTTLTSITANGGVTVAANGEIFVSHFGPLPFIAGQEGRNIYKITPTGEVFLFAEDVVLVGTGNTLDSQGNVYQGSFQQNKVVKLDDQGNVLNANFAAAGGAVGVLAIENDTIVICSCNTNSVIKVAQDGSSSVFASGGSFACPNGITKDGAGTIYVSNFSNGIVTKITRNGTATVLGNTGASGGHIAYRNVDDMLYLTSYSDHMLFKMDMNGDSEAFAGTGSSGSMDAIDPLQATFAKPNGLEFSPNGCNLYITQDEDVLREIIFNDGVCDDTGIENVDESRAFEIFPNPIADSFQLINHSNIQLRSIQVLDIQGQLAVSFETTGQLRYDVSNLAMGVYTILLTDMKGDQWIKKFIKE